MRLKRNVLVLAGLVVIVLVLGWITLNVEEPVDSSPVEREISFRDSPYDSDTDGQTDSVLLRLTKSDVGTLQEGSLSLVWNANQTVIVNQSVSVGDRFTLDCVDVGDVSFELMFEGSVVHEGRVHCESLNT